MRQRSAAQRTAVQMVGQDPQGELNPAHRARTAVRRPLQVLRGLARAAATAGLLTRIDAARADGLAVLLATHDDDLAGRADRRLRIVDGRLVEEPATHLTDSTNTDEAEVKHRVR